MIKNCLRLAACTLCLFFFTAPACSAPEKELSISEKNAQVLAQIASYADLEVLSISCLESIQALPDSIGRLTRLRELKIDNGNGCAMNLILPETIGNLQALKKLTLYGAQNSSGDGPQPRKRHPFPHSISKLKNLTLLDLGGNGFEKIPVFVKNLPRLKELGLSWNKLKTIQPFVANLKELMTLNLQGNDLTDLPDFLNALPKLTRIAIGNNCRITQNAAKMTNLRKRFPRIKFDFEDEYDCPAPE
jgi:Leucine-rich repeat (LRR) protein